MDCPHCGTAAAGPDQRFCAKCGTNLVPVEPPTAYGQAPHITGPLFADEPPPPLPPPPAPPAPPPLPPPPAPPPMTAPPTYAVPSMPPPAGPPPPPTSYADQPARRRRTPLVLLAVAALVAALIGAGGVVLLFGEDDPKDEIAQDRRDEGASTDASTAPTGASPSETTDTTETPDATETTEPAGFRCWDGGPAVTRVADCAPPTGTAGLAWVFPSATGATCSAEAGAQRATEAECTPLIGGDAVRFHYSEWRNRTALETYYRGNTIATIGGPGGRDDLTAAQVESRDPDVGYKVAIYYTDTEGLWSVTIYAADESQYFAALHLLEMRPFRQLRGKPA